MIFWVPESLLILSADSLVAGTRPLSDGVALSMRETELQDWLGRQGGEASHSSSPGWGYDLILSVCGIHPASAMATGFQEFDSELVSQPSSWTTARKES